MMKHAVERSYVEITVKYATYRVKGSLTLRQPLHEIVNFHEILHTAKSDRRLHVTVKRS